MSETPGLLVRQANRAAFHRLMSPEPGLVEVVEGVKRIAGGGAEVELAAGQFALLPDNLPLTVENIPAAGGLYRARAVMLGRSNVETAYRAAPPASPRPRLAPVGVGEPAEGLRDCFARLCAELQADPPTAAAILDLRRQELVLRLAEAGAVLGASAESGVAGQLRRMLAAAPAEDWGAALAASRLAMSEATLRRRLAAEGVSFQALLTDARMTHALALLQSTHWTIATVAQESGYDSPSRFAARFRERFGLAPGEIRHPRHQNERIGTKIDRHGRARRAAAS